MAIAAVQRTLNEAARKLEREGLHQSFSLPIIERAAIDEEARTVELAFSSSAPIETWFGEQVLVHEDGAVDLKRIRNAGALLVNHDRDDQVGVVEKAWCDEKDGKCRAVVRFSESARGEEIFRDVVSGIRRLVSVGASVQKTETTEATKGKTELVRVTRWTPHEISIVSVPADTSVGVGRALETETQNTQRTCERNLSNLTPRPRKVRLVVPEGLKVRAVRFRSK